MTYYTIKQTAELLDLSLSRIQAKIKQGHFPGHRFCECGKCILIPIKEVNAHLKSRPLKGIKRP